MMVRSPYRPDRYARGLGAGEPSWYAQWVNSGFNDGGRILAFVAAQPNGGDVQTLVDETGKSIVWNGGNGNVQGVAGPYLAVVNPCTESNGVMPPKGTICSTANLRLDQPRPGWFRSPGDDVMRAAIAKWVPYASTQNAPQGFSQAVPVLGGQTPEQAAAIREMSEQVSPGAAAAAGRADLSAAPSTNAESGAASIPMWVWALGAAAVAYFAFGGSSNGR